MRKASYIQTRIYHSWSISCFLRLKLEEGRSHSAAGICRQPVYSQGRGTGRGRDPSSGGSAPASPNHPFSWCPFLSSDHRGPDTIILAAASVSENWSKATLPLCSLDGFFSLPPLFPPCSPPPQKDCKWRMTACWSNILFFLYPRQVVYSRGRSSEFFFLKDFNSKVPWGVCCGISISCKALLLLRLYIPFSPKAASLSQACYLAQACHSTG